MQETSSYFLVPVIFKQDSCKLASEPLNGVLLRRIREIQHTIFGRDEVPE